MRAAVFVLGLLAALCAAQDNATLIGAAVRSRPAYDGSASQRTDMIPVLRYYGPPWFARTSQGVLEAGVRSATSRPISGPRAARPISTSALPPACMWNGTEGSVRYHSRG
jgi:outer membrane scaffolding protein for murein synthesis (MipA/OmpV family)